jgi:hypothetical protein
MLAVVVVALIAGLQILDLVVWVVVVTVELKVLK